MRNPEFLISKGVDLQKSLELFGTIEMYNETIGEFIISVPGKINKLREYLDANDMPNYAIYAHSLKSDARYFGFTKLSEIAYSHELKSKEGDVYYVYDNFNDLTKAVDEAINIIQEYMKDEPAPSTTANVEESVNIAPATPPTQGTNPYTAKTILVVDDSNIIRNFVKRIFDGQYEVGTAKDGQEAIDIISANKDNENIVAILLDLNMPRVDGFKVLEYMQENDLFQKNPVSIISGDSSKETIDKAFTYPIVDMLGKPFAESDVKRVIEKTLMYKDLI